MRIEDFSSFMIERHSIYLRRFQQKNFPPWTNDPILQAYRFCNVFRELDTVTVWMRQNIREPYADHKFLWLMVAIARTINHPPTLAELFQASAMPTNDLWDPSLMTKVLEDRKSRKEKLYTSAYMIRAESNRTKHWYPWPKNRYISEIVIGRLWKRKEEFASKFEREGLTLEEAWGFLNNDPNLVGWGPFMSYEVITDLRHTRYLLNAPDRMTWANAGPGALRGLNRIFDRPLKQKVKDPCAEMNAILLCLNQEFWPKGKDWGELEMRDVEHSLCEFDKYERARLGEGRPREKFFMFSKRPLEKEERNERG